MAITSNQKSIIGVFVVFHPVSKPLMESDKREQFFILANSLRMIVWQGPFIPPQTDGRFFNNALNAACACRVDAIALCMNLMPADAYGVLLLFTRVFVKRYLAKPLPGVQLSAVIIHKDL
jgi:hypothetical protein